MRIKFLLFAIFFWVGCNVYPDSLLFRKQTLNSNADVSISSPVDGQLFKYNGSKWINWTPDFLTSEQIDTEAEFESLLFSIFTPSDGSLSDDDLSDNSINDLNDVDTTGWATNKLLKFDASGNLIVGTDNDTTYTADGEGLELSGGQFSLELDGTTLSKSASGLKVNSITTTEISDGTIQNADIADDTISEAKLDIYNSPTDGYYLKYDATNGMTWASVSGGGGATYREITLLPSSAILDDNNPPATTIVESTGTGTPRFRVADFDQNSDEIIYFSFVMPSDYTAGSNIILDIYWFANATSGTCVWEACISATSEGDADTPLEESCASSNTASEAVNSTEANRLIKTTLTITNLDNVSAGDTVVLRFNRDADNASDDLSADARLRAIHVKIPRS